MAATNSTPLVRQQSQEPQMMLSNSTKARLMGSSPGLWLRSPVGWSGARGQVSRRPTRRYMQYNCT